MPPSNPGPADYERALCATGLSDVNVFHRQVTGSTSDDARATSGSESWLLETPIAIFVAETQTKGRGRGSNRWISPEGSISFTISAADVDVSRVGVLPLGVGVCVVDALRTLGAGATLKWPNDVLIDGDKVGGILCESSVQAGVSRVFIGIGINVNAASISPELRPHATALSASNVQVDRPALVADITARVVRFIRDAAAAQQVVEAWKAVSVPWWGESVSLVEGGIERTVTLLDVNPEGQLVVQDGAGVVRSFVSGEVRRIRVGGM